MDQDLSTMLLVDKMKLSKNKVSTACPSPQEYLDAIDPERVNYIITISSKLSGSYNSAVMAAVMAQENIRTARYTCWIPKALPPGKICFS